MGEGIHFAMDYLTEQTQLLNGEIDDITITAKDKNVIIIGAGDTGADCVATALRENCKSIVQFNKYTKLPEAITFTENASWPLAMPVFKMDYAYETKFGKEPRAYGVQTMRYDVDDKGHIRGLYTQILEQGENGMVMKEGPERFWLLTLYYYQSASKVQNQLYRMLLTLKRIEIESWRMIQTIKLIMKKYLLLEMLDVVKV